MSKKKLPLDDSDEFDIGEDDNWGEETADDPPLTVPPGRPRRRDWRDAERYREERELRRQIGDLDWFEDLDRDRRPKHPPPAKR